MWKTLSREKRWAMVYAPILVGVAIATYASLVSLVPKWLEGDPQGDVQVPIKSSSSSDEGSSTTALATSEAPSSEPVETPAPQGVQLEVIRTAVSEDGRVELHIGDDEPRPISATSVEVLVRNTGHEVAVVHTAEFVITEWSPFCVEGEGGPVPITAHYAVNLPRKKAEGQSVAVATSQEIRANRVDRFAFTVGQRTVNAGNSGPPALYALDIHLRHDLASAPVSAGSVVIVTPYPHPIYLDRRSSCGDLNREMLLRFAAIPGARSPELATLQKRIAAES